MSIEAAAGARTLAGEWHLEDTAGEHSATILLPGDVHSALEQAGIIPDPYFGRNERELRWVAERDWRLTRSFGLSAEDAAEGDWYLEVDGLDTVAEVSVNGVTVLEAGNAFRRWRADLGDTLKEGRNSIAILIRSSLRGRRGKAGRAAFPGPLQRGELATAERQHAAQAPVPFRLGLEHRARAARPLWRHCAQALRHRPHRACHHVAASRGGARRSDRDDRLQREVRGRGSGQVRDPRRGARRHLCPRRRRDDRDRNDHHRGAGALVAGRLRGATAPHAVHRHALRALRAADRLQDDPPDRRAGRRRPALRLRGQRPRDLLPGRELDSRRRPLLPHEQGEDGGAPAVGRRGQHEHDPRLGRRLLRGGLVLRRLRPAGPDGVAGLHVRLQPLSLHSGLPRRSRRGSRLAGAPAVEPCLPGALVRRQRTRRRAHLVRGVAKGPRPLPRQLRPAEPHDRGGAEARRPRRPVVAVEPILRAARFRRRLAQGRLRRHALLVGLARGKARSSTTGR